MQESAKIFSVGEMINNWAIFFRCSNNKSESFPFLSTSSLSGASYNKIVVAEDKKMVVSNNDIYLNGMCLVIF